MECKAPRTVIVMTVEEVYFQCARAIVRSDLWNPSSRVDRKSLFAFQFGKAADSLAHPASKAAPKAIDKAP